MSFALAIYILFLLVFCLFWFGCTRSDEDDYRL